MAVSKRLRFEVLRRDNYTCRYCGRTAPEVRVTIDHVLPVALGGRDEASNLVACCADCNSGKTSIAPDAPLLADVDERALRWAAAMHVAVAKASADHEAELEYRRQFKEAWDAWKLGTGEDAQPVPVDQNWETSVETFRTRGLPAGLLIRAVSRAMASKHIKPVNCFRYMCGIAWKQIEEIERDARAVFDGHEAAPATTFDDRLAAGVVAAAVLVWEAEWCQANGFAPTDEQRHEARESITALYPEEFSADELFAAAQAAGRTKRTDVEFFAGEEREFVVSLAWSYCRGAVESGAPAPTAATWGVLATQAVAAQFAGYQNDNIFEAAYWSARSSQPLFNGLDAPEKWLGDEWSETIAGYVRPLLLTQEEIDGHFEQACREAAERAQKPVPDIPDGWGS